MNGGSRGKRQRGERLLEGAGRDAAEVEHGSSASRLRVRRTNLGVAWVRRSFAPPLPRKAPALGDANPDEWGFVAEAEVVANL